MPTAPKTTKGKAKVGKLALAQPRFVTATSLFDGHDASINIIRRLLQRAGAEVIHLGHNRSVQEVVTAALQEDVQGIAISSYQGGHMEYFKYMIDLLAEADASHVKVFGGGGGVIVREEIEELQKYGVSRIYSPNDGRELGLEGMAREMVEACSFSSPAAALVEPAEVISILRGDEPQKAYVSLGRLLSRSQLPGAQEELSTWFEAGVESKVPVVGITGTGGAGKSSLIDEFMRRFVEQFPERKLALVSIDPTQRKTGGALLGDRLRMNSAHHPNIYMHSLATRDEHASISQSLPNVLSLLKAIKFDLIMIESAGVGQSDTMLVDHVDFSIYVMTSEYGADTQLEKISMLDYADLVVINKFDKERSKDALRAVRKQYRRNHNLFELDDEELPVNGTVASQFDDAGTLVAFHKFVTYLNKKLNLNWEVSEPQLDDNTEVMPVVPPKRRRYLAEISEAVKEYKEGTQLQKRLAGQAQALYESLATLGFSKLLPGALEAIADVAAFGELQALAGKYNELVSELDETLATAIREFPAKREQFKKEQYNYEVRGKTISVDARTISLSGLSIPKIVLPEFNSWEEIAEFIRSENVPGEFPFTAGVFPLKRTNEDPTRMFAGEGNPERTNRRFHFISEGQPAARLSTAFDSITLYGENPDLRPDIYGKIGNAGVSICTVDDIKKLYSGFNLAEPTTSVSMTINGPAPILLAFFLHAAIDQQVALRLKAEGKWEDTQKKIAAYFKQKGVAAPSYAGDLPSGNEGLGLEFLGLSAADVAAPALYEEVKTQTLSQVRGTVQADILKEDQAQNTCIFSTDFALRMMGDMQQYFIDHDIKNFYSVSISGYHIAEAGANPISQVAFTLANGFTFIEYYLSRGMDIDKFARNLSFFFSNGMDPEYAVIGRVARRIWAVALKNKYRAGERAQKLKYHIQTSGRSLHAQEISFNDIRTTLQALYAIMDNCNSLHTNAYDEAITTPTPESVRRAIAIQLVINKELGLTTNENPLQGSYFMTALTDMVESAILAEFEAISERGGVLGAMETMYQRHKIQEESMNYEGLKGSGELPIIGVNTFLGDGEDDEVETLMRSTEGEKKEQLQSLERFKQIHARERDGSLDELKKAVREQQNIFTELMNAVRYCSLGEISDALYQVGGSYRRNM